MADWDERFLSLSEYVSDWSRDPSTRVGAIITDTKHRIRSIGFNGFPRGVNDLKERYTDRETKLKMVVHAEPNAIANANGPVDGCTIYVSSLPPCSSCAGLIIQSGIHRVVFRKKEIPCRWQDSVDASMLMFREAGIEVTEI